MSLPVHRRRVVQPVLTPSGSISVQERRRPSRIGFSGCRQCAADVVEWVICAANKLGNSTSSVAFFTDKRRSHQLFPLALPDTINIEEGMMRDERKVARAVCRLNVQGIADVSSEMVRCRPA